MTDLFTQPGMLMMNNVQFWSNRDLNDARVQQIGFQCYLLLFYLYRWICEASCP